MLLRIYKEYGLDGREWFAEWCPKLHDRRGLMVSFKGLGAAVRNNYNPGYSSVYAFSKEDAELIRASGSSRGLHQYCVGAWAVALDLDDGDKQLEQVERVLQDKSLEYFVYLSGGKGNHVYVPQTEFVYDKRVPYSHKMFIENLGLDVDFTLYQHGRILSLPRRLHPKTKVRKQFVKHVPGDRLALELVDPPQPSFSLRDYQEASFSMALVGVADACNTPPSVGNRHTTIWGLAMDLARANVPIDVAEGLLIHLNNEWPYAKDHKDVLIAVRQAYKRCSE